MFFVCVCTKSLPDLGPGWCLFFSLPDIRDKSIPEVVEMVDCHFILFSTFFFGE